MSWDDTTENIPIVDFEALSLPKEVNLNDEEVKKTCHQIFQAFSNIGFVYLKNTGITESQVHKVEDVANHFFSLDKEIKGDYRRMPNDPDTNLVGWGAMQAEKINPKGNFDLKETYDIIPMDIKKWPDDVVPNFQSIIKTFFTDCTELAHRMLDALSVGLALKDTGYLRRNHQIAEGKTKTALRLLYYPPLTDHKPKESDSDQVRLGEHSDYGSITLLFQDDVGGLEVQCRDGIYRPAIPIPGTVLVNIADMMQRWTSDKLVSNKHRVLVPQDAVLKGKKRQSMAFFVIPDDDCIISSLDGSGKYEPIISEEYLLKRIAQSYY